MSAKPKATKVSPSQRRRERQALIRRIKQSGGPCLLQRVGDTGFYIFNNAFVYHAKSEKAAIELYADSIVRVSDFLRGSREWP